jgi:hypothetical protein
MYKIFQISIIFEGKAKKIINYNIFRTLIVKNNGIYIIFGILRKCGRYEIF